MARVALDRAAIVPTWKMRLKTTGCEKSRAGRAPLWCGPERCLPCNRPLQVKLCRPPVLLLAFREAVGYQSPMKKESIENLAAKLAESLPDGLRSMREDLEQNFRSVLRSQLSRLDLVTREEFDVQEAVLQRTREKLEALEQRLAELENP